MESTSSWRLPPDSLALLQNEVHVWRACLDVDPIDLESLRTILNSDERAREWDRNSSPGKPNILPEQAA